ncbi:MAG: hypothetical protein ACJA2S_000101 [Cyclobacteriaceae bacterium]|jgi:hypothetical protein
MKLINFLLKTIHAWRYNRPLHKSSLQTRTIGNSSRLQLVLSKCAILSAEQLGVTHYFLTMIDSTGYFVRTNFDLKKKIC